MQQKVSILSAFVFGMGGFVASAEATARQCTSAECACERALQQNTVEALERFLTEYQHDASSKETACAALGVPPEDEVGEDRNADYQPNPLPTE